ncbi:hypothetical protein FACS1894152_3060 [Bacilli bacterium]|nr:hypothetical protein FACS1894152_3060 [Bacilli bacterium]
MVGFLDWIKDDWENRRFIFINEAVAFISGIGASLLMALTVPNVNFLLVYTLYTINAITAMTACICRKSVSMIGLNVVYLVIDIIALYGLLVPKLIGR